MTSRDDSMRFAGCLVFVSVLVFGAAIGVLVHGLIGAVIGVAVVLLFLGFLIAWAAS